MAGEHEIKFDFAPNATLFAVIDKNDSGTLKVNITGGDTWEVWNDNNVATYDVALTERGGGGKYTATFPAIASGDYGITIYQGSDLDGTDPVVGGGQGYWNGTTLTRISALSSSGLDNVSTTEPSGNPSGWNFREWLIWLFSRFANKGEKTATHINVYNKSGTKITEQSYTVGATEVIQKTVEP